MSKIKTKNEKVKRISQLTVVNPTAAGIDVSDTEMMVAYLFSLYFSTASWRLFFVDTLFCNDLKISN